MSEATKLREELEQVALAGEGYGALLRVLSRATQRRARLVAVHGGLLATSEDAEEAPAASVPASGVPASQSLHRGVDPAVARYALAMDTPTQLECTDGMRSVAVALRAGTRRVGLLLVEEPIGRDEAALMNAAVVPFAIEAVRRDAEASAIADRASRLVDELRFGSFRSPDQLVRAGQRFRLALDHPHAAAVFVYDGGNLRAWHTAIRWIEMPVSHEEHRGWTVLAGDIGRELRRIRDRLEGIVGDAPVLAASGPVVSDPTETARSFREAEVVLALLRHRPNDAVLPYNELGLQSLLMAVPKDRLQAFVAQSLGPLVDRPELIDTLQAWYASNGSRAGVADRIGIHRNSVGYRIARIRDLLGADPLAPRIARQLQAALDAREVLEALDNL